MRNGISGIVVALALTVATVLLLTAAWASLSWRSELDSPLMIYAGRLVAGGAVPYRDFFDMNMPGTYFVMAGMGRVFGWDDLGFRIFDLLCLASIAVSTLFWMRRLGALCAVAASVVFPLWYLSRGPSLSLQREYIALVPFAAMLAVVSGTELKSTLRILFIGLLIGVTCLIKPQFLLLSLPILFAAFQRGAASGQPQRQAAALIGGMLVPLSSMFLYLLSTGGLGPFVDIASNYWPLYAHLTEAHVTISGLDRLRYIVNSTQHGLMTFYAPMAVIGLVVLDRDRTQRPHAVLMGALLATAAIYPALSGQFWEYHWIPFYYVALCAASLSARAVRTEGWSVGKMASLVAVIFLLFSLSSITFGQVSRSWKGNGGDTLPSGGVPDEVGQFLKSHMNRGDTVQPLDWTGGAVHGMLLARAPLATRFLYDFHFYHHVSTPYIRNLRLEFMREMNLKKPRFIIQVFDNKPWPTGEDTTQDFPELQAFLEQHYLTVQQGTTYRILQRSDGLREGATQPAADSGGR